MENAAQNADRYLDGLANWRNEGLIDPGSWLISWRKAMADYALWRRNLQRGLYRCAVSVAGVSDLQSFMLSRIDMKVSGRNQKPSCARLQAETRKGRSLTEVSPARFCPIRQTLRSC